jgi:hypothetical protein
MLKMCAREVREEGSWYCSMFLCFSFRVLPGSSLSMNFITGGRSGSAPATRRMMVYPSPNLEKQREGENKGVGIDDKVKKIIVSFFWLTRK